MAVKKTTASKTTTAAKKTTTKTTTTAKKTTTTASSSGLTVRGNKKISTFQKEFTKKFPYLGILFFNRNGVEIKSDRLFSEIAGSLPNGNVTISGNKKVGNLEKEFEKNFNIKIQVYYMCKSVGRVITHYTDDWTLSERNAYCEKDPDDIKVKI